jgi:hypothetical protein
MILKLADIVCAAVTLLNVYELTAPTEVPSTRTFAMVYPVFASMVKVLFDPWLTEIAPDGEIVPPVPADAAIVYEIDEKVALMVWAAVTLLKVYELMAPWDTPSTVTLEIW